MSRLLVIIAVIVFALAASLPIFGVKEYSVQLAALGLACWAGSSLVPPGVAA